MRKLVISLILLGILTSLLTGMVGAEEKEEYICVAVNLQHPFWKDIINGVEFADEVLPAKVSIVGPQTFNVNKQANVLQQVIAREPAGIMVAAYDPAVNPLIKEAIEKGIPTCTIEADQPDSERLFYVGLSNYKNGKLAAEVLADEIGDQGKVAILTNAGASNSEEKVRGFKDEINNNHPNIEIVEIGEDKADPQFGSRTASTFLRKYQDLDAIQGINAASGKAAAIAIKEAGKVGDVKIIAMDRDDKTLEYIEDGVIQASIASKTVLKPYLAALLLYQHNHHSPPITTNNEKAGITPLPDSVNIKGVVIDKNNVEYFYHEKR